MKVSSLFKSFLIPLFLPYSLFIGCSVVGAVIGGVSSPSRPGRVTSSLGLDSIIEGTEIQLVRFDRSTLDGSFKGLFLYPGKLYARTYDTLVGQSAYRGFIPELNQRITLTSAAGSYEGFFKGIDRGELLFLPVAETDTVSISLEDIDVIQASDSLRLEGKTARKLVRDGTMPGRRIILLEVGRQVVNVPFESVELVQLKGSSSGALTGFLAGAAVDVTVILLVAAAQNQAESDMNRAASGCGNQSCTTVRH